MNPKTLEEADGQLAKAIYLSQLKKKKTKRQLMADAAEKRAKRFQQGGKKHTKN